MFTGCVASVRAVVQTLGMRLTKRKNRVAGNMNVAVCSRKLRKEVLERFNFVSRC